MTKNYGLLKKNLTCHPGLDSGSSFHFKFNSKIELFLLDSRFRGNDN